MSVSEPRREAARGDVTAGVLVLSDLGMAGTRESRRALYEEAVAILRREYAAELRLPEVARRIGASTRALQRAFAEHGERSFSEELRLRRLEVAARLLEGTDLPVGAVALRVGYGNHAPFSKAFRRYYGVAPRQHRQPGLTTA